MSVSRVAAVILCLCVAVCACPARAVPEFVRDLEVPGKVPPPEDEWVASPRRAERLGENAQDALADGRAADALRLVTRAIETDDETNPAERPYWTLRAACLSELGDRGPEEAAALYNEALLSAGQGDFTAARRLYESALVADPLMLWAANNRAWLAATHPDPEARSDPDAIAYALYACVRSQWHNWSFIDTLGAAYAEADDFASAERCAERALALAPAEQKRELRDALADYRAGRPRRVRDEAAPMAAEDDAGDRRRGTPFLEEDDTATEKVVLERVTLQQLSRIMVREGYAVTVRSGRFIEWKMDGIKSQLFVAKDGGAIQFHAAFDEEAVPLARVNEWNRSKRFSRSYLDDEDDPHLELDLDCSGGICEGRLLDFLGTCRVSLSTWVEEVVR